MARWCKRWGMIAAVVMAFAVSSSPAQAQLLQRLGLGGPPADGPPPFGGGPEEGGEPCPDFPNPSNAPPPSPYSLNADNTPNGLEDWPDHRYIPPPSYVVTTRAEYLRWRFRSGDIPIPLVTTSINGGTGALGEPGTRIILGQGTYNYDSHDSIGGPGSQGGRLTLGIAPGFFFPVEVSGFWLNDYQTLFHGSTNGTDVLARPALAANLGQETAYVAGFPGLATGAIDINAQISLWGAETHFVWNIAQTDVWMLDLRFGYRYMYLGETLNLGNSLQTISPDVAVPFGGFNQFSTGFSTRVNDRFFARNDFNGAQLGLRNVLNCWRFNLFIDTKLAVGQTRMETETTGLSAVTGGNASLAAGQILPGGILALNSNGGRQSRSQAGFIPEGNISLGYQITEHLRVFGGYDFMYWSRIVRPANQLNNVIDSRQVPTDVSYSRASLLNPLTLPQPTFNTTGFWAQGYHFGLELSF